MLVALARAGYDVTGIDLSPTMVRMARRRVRHAQTPVVQGQVQALPFSAETFDSILSTFPPRLSSSRNAGCRSPLFATGRRSGHCA